MFSVLQGIPVGLFRVIGVDLFSHEDYPVKDYETQEEAFQKADIHNRARCSSMSDVYYVYNHTGRFLRGPEHLTGKVASVSP